MMLEVPSSDASLSSFPFEIELEIASFLNATDLVLGLSSVSRSYRSVLLTGEHWREKCMHLWSDKVYVHPRFRANPTTYASYFGSIRDSKRCQFENQAEICSLHFHFRFRPTAGDYWISLDPSYNGSLPMYRKFRPDGSLSCHPAEHGYNYVHDGGMPFTSHCAAPRPDPLENDVVRNFIPRIYWRMTKSRRGVKGQFVKLNHWPALQIGRTEDWGWTLTSVWTYYRTCCSETSSLSKQWLHEKDDYELYI